MNETEVIWHLGHPVVLEKEPIEVAQVPVHGERLEESVILHPRYIPDGVKHKRIKVRGFRRGRCIDILLDEPLRFEGESYGVLNFKGVGANADREMVIHPTKWYREPIRGGHDHWQGEETVSWVPRAFADNFDRIWGAMRRSEARKEYKDTTLKDLGIPQIPHVAALPIPKRVAENIGGGDTYGQLVRAERTNIRTEDPFLFFLSYEERKRTAMFEKVVAADIKIIQAQRELRKARKKLDIRGLVVENRFIDGSFTDLENWVIEDDYPRGGYELVLEVVRNSHRYLLVSEVEKEAYYECVAQATGIQVPPLLWESLSPGALKRVVFGDMLYFSLSRAISS